MRKYTLILAAIIGLAIGLLWRWHDSKERERKSHCDARCIHGDRQCQNLCLERHHCPAVD